MGILVATLALGLAEWQVCRANFGTPYNGYGAIEGTFRASNNAPMRYRVLLAWLLGQAPTPTRVYLYIVVKIGLLGLTLWVSQGVLGSWVGMALALIVTFQFDYWEQYPELLGILGILSGDPWLATVGAIAWGLSKETCLALIPLAAVTGQWGALLGIVAWGAARLIQGKAKLYCERWTFWAYNWPDLKAAWGRIDPCPLVAVVWSIAAMASLLWIGEMAPLLQRTAWIVPVYLAAGWTLARAREVRVFLPMAIWMVGAWA